MNNPAIQSANGLKTERLLSLDVLRGIIILMMLFVNDVAGVTGLPSWMKHMPGHIDGMTFVDLVFPAFLFMVGMSIPLAIGRRLAAGHSMGKVFRHVLIRSFGLIVLGFFMVNGEGMKGGGLVSPAMWNLCLFIGIVLIWNDYGNWKAGNPRWVWALRILGIALLAFCGFAFSGPAGSGITALRPEWWGILGLIGWSYLAACIIYIPARRHPEAILGLQVLLYSLFVAEDTGALKSLFFYPSGSFAHTFASHAAIVLAGTLLTMILYSEQEGFSIKRKIRWTVLYAIALYLASALLHSLAHLNPIFIISKIMATPTWCLRTSAYTVALWLLIYLIVDRAGMKKGSKFLAMAGNNALFAYVLAPAVAFLFEVIKPLSGGVNIYGYWDQYLITGILRSAAIAVLLTWLAGYLKRFNISPKL